jgi:menaquinol-cytochrome c reductase iron-sulfur subunit
MKRLFSRREVIKIATGAGGGMIGILLSIPAIGFLISPLFTKGRVSWQTVGPIDNVPINIPTPMPVKIPTGEGWQTPAPDRIVYVVRTDQQKVLAIANICTHMQCPVHWDTELGRFLCPCHGGLYDKEGRNIGGPPPQPLPQWQSRTYRNGQGQTILEVSNQLNEQI